MNLKPVYRSQPSVPILNHTNLSLLIFVRYILILSPFYARVIQTVSLAQISPSNPLFGVAIRYGLEGRGLNLGEGEIFRTRPNQSYGPPSLLYKVYRVSFPGLKWTERGVNHPPLSNAEVKERVKLYFYSPSGPSWLVLGRNLLYPYIHVSCPPSMPYAHSIHSSLFNTPNYFGC